MEVLALGNTVQDFFDEMRAGHLRVGGESGSLAEVLCDNLADARFLLLDPPVVCPSGSFQKHVFFGGLDEFVSGLLLADALAGRVAAVELGAEVLDVCGELVVFVEVVDGCHGAEVLAQVRG